MAGGQLVAEQLAGAEVAVGTFAQLRQDQQRDAALVVDAAQCRGQSAGILLQGEAPGRETAGGAPAVVGKAGLGRQFAQCLDGRRQRFVETAPGPQRAEVVYVGPSGRRAARSTGPDAGRAHVESNPAFGECCGRRGKKGKNQPGGNDVATGCGHHQRCR